LYRPQAELRSVLDALSPINDNSYSFSNILHATSSIDNNDINFAFYDLQLLESDFDLLSKLQLSEDYNVLVTDLNDFKSAIYDF
jgi:hypothetical protein